jgi:hypothetical protein
LNAPAFFNMQENKGLALQNTRQCHYLLLNEPGEVIFVAEYRETHRIKSARCRRQKGYVLYVGYVVYDPGHLPRLDTQPERSSNLETGRDRFCDGNNPDDAAFNKPPDSTLHGGGVYAETTTEQLAALSAVSLQKLNQFNVC